MERDGTLAVPKAWYEPPICYHPKRLNVAGRDHDVVWPACSARMDYELEFGAYVGRGGRDIGKADARDHNFGYTIFNDFSARDEQTKDMPGQLGQGDVVERIGVLRNRIVRRDDGAARAGGRTP